MPPALQQPQIKFEQGRVQTPELLADIQLPASLMVMGQTVDLVRIPITHYTHYYWDTLAAGGEVGCLFACRPQRRRRTADCRAAKAAQSCCPACCG